MATPSPLASLPSALIQSIFTFAVDAPTQYAYSPEFPRDFTPLALVSREWNAFAHDVFRAVSLEKLAIDITEVDAVRYLKAREKDAVTRRGFVRELELRDANCFSRMPDCEISLRGWRGFFGQMPLLEVLNLRCLGRNDVRRLARLIQAAREKCPQLQRIFVLVRAPMRRGEVGEPPELTQALIDAVASPTSASKGLRELRLGIPSAVHPARTQVMTKFLTRICDVCPDLELLSGYVDLLDQTGKLTCTEQWFITTETWERFCATMTKLKTFNWVVAPFATSFFEIFGCYPKPQLEQLVFSTPMNWNWTRCADLGIAQEATGYGPTARNAHEALKACPNLLDLEIALYLPGDAGGRIKDTGFPWAQPFHVPQEPMIDQEIFGDEFCEALTAHCKKLQTLNVHRVLPVSKGNRTIMAFTDRAMCALATLSSLRSVELDAVNITGKGLFSLAACFERDRENATLPRKFEITVGDDKEAATQQAFYDVVLGFLGELVACEPENLLCASCPMALRLVNGNSTCADEKWSEGFLLRVRELALAARKKHARARVLVFTRGYYEEESVRGGFSEITEFGFYTDGGRASASWGWKGRPGDERVDHFVFNRAPAAA